MSYIRFEHIDKSFKQDVILKDVNFELEQGQIHGFVGRNGSGKTVIFKMLCGLLLPTSGNIYFQEHNISKSGKFIDSLGVLIENPGFIPHYTGFKNLSILNSLSKNPVSKQEIYECLELVGLDSKSKKPVKAYSLGMRQKLGIAQAIMNKPELLILDEPLNSLDEASVKDFRELFLKLKNERNTTILLASHMKEDIELLCDRIFYLREKRVIEDIEMM